MAKKINKTELAKKYASALFQEAVQQGQAEAVGDEIRALTRLMSDSPEFNALIVSRFINAKNRTEMMKAVLDKLGMSDLIHRFFGVLIENSRLYIFGEIEPVYQCLYEEYKGILPVFVVAAQTLDDPTKNRLTNVLKKIFNKEIRLNIHVNPLLIGGLTVQVGSVMADISVKTKLQKLNLVMKGVGA